jgi:hypothetical protein
MHLLVDIGCVDLHVDLDVGGAVRRFCSGLYKFVYVDECWGHMVFLSLACPIRDGWRRLFWHGLFATGRVIEVDDVEVDWRRIGTIKVAGVLLIICAVTVVLVIAIGAGR